jgi:hypothetical protein
MKRSTQHRSKTSDIPCAWRDAEYAALRADAADRCDDRLSTGMFDAADEREEVDVIVHDMHLSLN